MVKSISVYKHPSKDPHRSIHSPNVVYKIWGDELPLVADDEGRPASRRTTSGMLAVDEEETSKPHSINHTSPFDEV